MRYSLHPSIVTIYYLGLSFNDAGKSTFIQKWRENMGPLRKMVILAQPDSSLWAAEEPNILGSKTIETDFIGTGA